jgi:hypothetical protein
MMSTDAVKVPIIDYVVITVAYKSSSKQRINLNINKQQHLNDFKNLRSLENIVCMMTSRMMNDEDPISLEEKQKAAIHQLDFQFICFCTLIRAVFLDSFCISAEEILNSNFSIHYHHDISWRQW